MPQGAATSREEKKVENKEVRILVVDDEPTMADSLRQNFVEEGYSVDTAPTGAAAIVPLSNGRSIGSICLSFASNTARFVVAEIMRQGNMPIALIRLAVTREKLTRDMDINWKFYGDLPVK